MTVDTAPSRQGIQSSAWSVDAWTIHAGIAEGGRDPDMPDIPDCIESADEAVEVFDLDVMWQGLLGSHPGRPECQHPRGIRARCQTRESKERRARKRHECWRRRAAAKTSGGDDPATTEDERLDAAIGQASTSCKVARVAPLITVPRPRLDHTAGCGAIILQLVQPTLLPPPHHWDHQDGQPIGSLGPLDFPANPQQVLAKARVKPHKIIVLPLGPDLSKDQLIAKVNPRPNTPPPPPLPEPFATLPMPPFDADLPPGWPHALPQDDVWQEDWDSNSN